MSIKIIFTDVGGVLLNDGWDTAMRRNVADRFGIDWNEMQQRHEMVFEDYERGRLLFDEYLQHVVFFRNRPFTVEDFKKAMSEYWYSHDDMIQLVKNLKKKHGLPLAILSNEGKEIAAIRFEKFGFKSFIDYFVVSGFVGLRKPDLRIFKLALGLCVLDPKEVLFIDDRLQHIEAAKQLGICTIHHTDFQKSKQAIEKKLINN